MYHLLLEEIFQENSSEWNLRNGQHDATIVIVVIVKVIIVVIIVVVIVVIFIIIVVFSILLGILVISFLILILFIFVGRSLLVPIFACSGGSLLIITSLEPLVKNEVSLVHLLSEHHPEWKECTFLQLILIVHVSLHVSLTLGEFAFVLLRVNVHPKLREKLVLEESGSLLAWELSFLVVLGWTVRLLVGEISLSLRVVLSL